MTRKNFVSEQDQLNDRVFFDIAHIPHITSANYHFLVHPGISFEQILQLCSDNCLDRQPLFPAFGHMP